ncbi:MAG: hypothetical protein ACON3Z_17820 [Bradymonadia bacterium]
MAQQDASTFGGQIDGTEESNQLPPDEDAAVDGTPDGSLTAPTDGTFRAPSDAGGNRVPDMGDGEGVGGGVDSLCGGSEVVDVDLTDEFGFADDIISIAANLGEDGGSSISFGLYVGEFSDRAVIELALSDESEVVAAGRLDSLDASCGDDGIWWVQGLSIPVLPSVSIDDIIDIELIATGAYHPNGDDGESIPIDGIIRLEY